MKGEACAKRIHFPGWIVCLHASPLLYEYVIHRPRLQEDFIRIPGDLCVFLVNLLYNRADWSIDKRMTVLWLIRHGQTDWNVEGRYQGQSDVPLNATGLDQAAALAASLDGQHFDALYSSDLARAYQTAEVIAAHTGLPVQTDPRLREINQGDWQGRTLDEIKGIYNEGTQARRVTIDPVTARAPGGESVWEVSQRMAQAADDIARRYPAGRVLVVGHGLALATLYCQAENIPLAQVYSRIPENTQSTIIQWEIRAR
jgi:broad specificity phosphatase PhoE